MPLMFIYVDKSIKYIYFHKNLFIPKYSSVHRYLVYIEDGHGTSFTIKTTDRNGRWLDAASVTPHLVTGITHGHILKSKFQINFISQ